MLECRQNMGASSSTPLPTEQLCLLEAAAAKRRRDRRRARGRRPGGYVPREQRVRDILETLTRRASELELGVAVRVQTTRCQSECADGPNVKLLPEGRVLNGVRTTAEADEALERCATYAPE